MKWIDIKHSNTVTELKGESKKIIEALRDSNDEFFERQKIGHRTSLIKRELVILGHTLDYKVEANRILSSKDKDGNFIGNPNDLEKIKAKQPGFRNTEWLYDLHWYTEHDIEEEPYAPILLPLVMECEWGNIRVTDKKKSQFHENKEEFLNGEVKFDFQKIVASNAELRLMIFKISNISERDKLSSYFDKVINGKNEPYAHLEDNAKFLFVAYHFSDRTFYYKEIIKEKQK